MNYSDSHYAMETSAFIPFISSRWNIFTQIYIWAYFDLAGFSPQYLEPENESGIFSCKTRCRVTKTAVEGQLRRVAIHIQLKRQLPAAIVSGL